MPTYLAALLVVLAWIGAGLIYLGWNKGTLGAFRDQIRDVKEHVDRMGERFVTRTEFEARHADVLEGLRRIETKVDILMRGNRG